MPSLLVTNDFPPKVGGIQSYLYELWRRLPASDATVLTTPHSGAHEWDAAQRFRIERAGERVLLPTRSLARRIDALAREIGAEVIFLDPMLPLGHLGKRLSLPYVIVAHGAEITVPGRLPVSSLAARGVLRGASAVVAAGHYPAAVAARVARGSLAGVEIPPGVDVNRFRPLDADTRESTRRRLGLHPDRPLVLGVSRLVPRKGFDVLLEAVAGLDASVCVAIAGAGRDRSRLERVAQRHSLGERAQFLGRVDDADLPALYACADVFAMCCRERWGGLEAEGFGIVFLEAAACGVPAVAGRSGGSHEAVADGETGLVVPPRDVGAVCDALAAVLGDDAQRAKMGEAARARAVEQFSYDLLVQRLAPIATGVLAGLDQIGET